MAIIESVVIGSGSNRVGEVVLSTVKGRTIAKKYQSKVHNPRTLRQENQRNRMANCIALYKVPTGPITISMGSLGTPGVQYEDGYIEIDFLGMKEKLAVDDGVRMFGLDLSGNMALIADYSLTQSDLNLGTLHLAFGLTKPDAQYKCGAIMYKRYPN
jgi:hypothetical protein